jgi:peptide/nickel transport system substrate-binding protein
VLSPSGIKATGPTTIEFHLEAANGNFPYLVSSDNYNAIIVPKGTDFATWDKTFIGTGPFKLKSYTQNVGADFVANPDYWGGAPYLDSTAFTFYSSQQPQILALQGSSVDVIVQFVTQGAQSLLSNSSYSIIKLKSANHRELSMRNDMAPFTDARVRQAIALCLDRPAMVQALLDGDGEVGNDSPFAPKFPSTNTTVPQRVQDIAKAKQLLAAAGHAKGFSTTLTTEQYEEIPELAQVIQQAATKIGVNIKLKVETQANYYGKATYGNSDWLDAIMSLVDYGDRGVPNVFLDAPLTSNGPWNAAHFKNPTYDNLVKQYVAAVDLQTQKTIAGKIETLLLDETPLVIPYFIDGLTATTSSVHGVNPTSISAIYLKDAYKSA